MPIYVNNLSAPNDTNGQLVQVLDSTPVDNITTFYGPSGSVWKRVTENKVFRASWAIVGSADCTARLQSIFNMASVGTVLFDVQDYTINGSLSIPSGKILEFKDSGRIVGTGTITGGLIKAHWLQQCFGTGLSFSGISTVYDRMSVRWFGATGNGSTDDSPAINKLVNIIVATSAPAVRICYFPTGNYLLNSPIIAARFNSGTNKYAFISIDFIGADPMKSPATYTTQILANFTNTFAIGIQYGRNITIENIKFTGAYTLPNSFTNIDLINKQKSDWIQSGVSANRYSPYSAIVLDPFCDVASMNATSGGMANAYAGLSAYYQGSASSTGTSQVNIRQCCIQNFYIGIILSPNARSQENEMIYLDQIQLGFCYVGVASCQAQTKQNVARNIMVWLATYSVFNSIDFGSQSGGGGGTEFFIDGMNIAGGVRQILDSRSNAYSIHMSRVFAESLWKIGNVSGPVTVSIKDCQFDFMNSASNLPTPDSLITGGLAVSISDSIFRYYTGDSTTLNRPIITLSPVYFKNVTFSDYPLALSYNQSTGAQLWPSSYQSCTSIYTGGGTSSKWGDKTSGVKPLDYVFLNCFAEEGLISDSRSLNKDNSLTGFGGTGWPLITSVRVEYTKSAEQLIRVFNARSGYTMDQNTGAATFNSSTDLIKYVKPGDYLFAETSSFQFLGMVKTIDATTVTLIGGQQGNPAIPSSFRVYINTVYTTNYPIACTITSGSNILTNVENLHTANAFVGNRFDHPFLQGLFLQSYDLAAKTITLSGAATGTCSHATLNNGQPTITYTSIYPPMFYNDCPPELSYLIGGAIWEVNGANDLYPASKYVIKNTTVPGSTLHKLEYNTLDGSPHKCTIATLRTYYGLSSMAYYVTDLTKQGAFYYDATDTSTSDDGVNTIVGAGSPGARFKRVSATLASDAFVTLASSQAISSSMKNVLVKSSSPAAAQVYTLDPVALAGITITIVKADNDGFNVTATPISGTIAGDPNRVLSTQYQFIKIKSDGVNFYDV